MVRCWIETPACFCRTLSGIIRFLLRIAPPIVEVLLIPFHVADEPIGTIWAIAHDESRKFDAEDERIMRFPGQIRLLGISNVEAG